jgi:hypothetical protein
MTDRRSSKKPLKHIKNFLRISFNIQEVHDEAYIQILKQITLHPDHNKCLRGWNMFAIIASTYPPSKRLFYSLMNFLYTEIKTNKNDDILRHANFVLARLNRIFLTGSRNQIPCDKEILYIEVRYNKKVNEIDAYPNIFIQRRISYRND